MDRQVSKFETGALAFTGMYLVFKSIMRLNEEMRSEYYGLTCKFNNVKSQVCTWAMGAVGFGLFVSSLH